MKKLVAVILGISIISASQALAQRGEGSRPPPGGPGGQGPENEAELTQAQVAKIAEILAQFDPNNLTAETARAIHEAFREAGIRPGRGMKEAIEAAGFDAEMLRELDPPPGEQGENGRGGGQGGPGGNSGRPSSGQGGGGDREGQSSRKSGGYSLEQAVSDRAQLNTIAFSGLAFITGDFGASTFMPPGKVCDYFGFQYMRDIDSAGKGHNPKFLNRVAGNVLHILNERQLKLFADLAAEQAPQFEKLALMRMPLIQAFHRQLDGNLPTGSAGLNREAVIRYTGDIFEYDARLSYRRAEVFGMVAATLTQEQRDYLGQMKFGDFNSWPDLDERDKLKRAEPGSSRFFNVAYMTYASEFFSWYAGSVEADTYFCPERHGTYFGGFYMKDMPAMGKRDYDISTSTTGDRGENFLGLLSTQQRGLITAIIGNQRNVLAEMITVRKAISVELRKFLAGGSADAQAVLALGRRYGELDGEVSWMYAAAFAEVNRTLSKDQRSALKRLRQLDGYDSAPAYMYSQALQSLPAIRDYGFLLGGATGLAN